MTSRVVRSLAPVVIIALCLVATPSPAAAQDYDLFDRWSVDLLATFMAFDTKVRLDSPALGIGTEIDFESDLGLESDKVIPSINLKYQSRSGAHRFGFAYFDADRSATEQVATEIRFGDLIIPVDADVTVGFDWEQLSFDYAWFFLRRDRYMLGAWLAVRWVDVTASIEVLGQEIEVGENASQDGPLPAIGVEYRLGMTANSRFVLNAGILEADIGDINGATGLLRAAFEVMPWKHIGFVGTISASYADAETQEEDLAEFEVNTSTTALSFGLRARF